MEEPKKKKAAAKKKPAGAANNTAFCRIVKGRRLAGEEAGSEWCRRDKGDCFFADRLLLSLAIRLLSGRGEADFDLTGFSEAVGRNRRHLQHRVAVIKSATLP
ncbi:hypothetical protein [Mesorhizobium muleiense]|uniref:hypothetical protein n=1 Tax=Mesorhizobium muleiense TaxID=1004279 RepID=UPI000A4629F6|nr:hypothetical protein [Mesorhizobium muleiense]MCF6103825.1 hypothetical protein [Mesorhizobium muleiense]